MEQPLAYKFVGHYFTLLVDDESPEDEECQPMYAPIEDEE
jgi:hypothetical protein